MSNLLSRIARIAVFPSAVSAPFGEGFSGGVARSLLERAEARSGLDPRQAQELRLAASAYLRVVR